MKIYSQSNPINTNQDDNNLIHEQFSFHPNYLQDTQQQPIPSQQSALPQKMGKFSFRLQPQLYFQKKNPEKEKLYQVTSHIHVASEEEKVQSQVNLSKMPGSRKRIFDRSVLVTQLKEKVSCSDSAEANTPITINVQSQSHENIHHSLVHPQSSIKESRFQGEMVSHANNSSNFQSQLLSKLKSKKNIHYAQFDHEDTNRILTKPILAESNTASFQKMNPDLENLIRSYPKILSKVQKNSEQLTELSKKLDNKIAEDNKHSEYFLQLMAEKERRNKDLQEKNQYYLEQLQKKDFERDRAALELEQHKRLQQLILQNKYLCAKVLEQPPKTQNPELSQEEIRIQQRIKELRKMRNQHQASVATNQSLNIDSSMVPRHYLTDPKPQSAARLERTVKIGSSALSEAPGVATNFQVSITPERDARHDIRSAKIEKVYVPITRIY